MVITYMINIILKSFIYRNGIRYCLYYEYETVTACVENVSI